jgi:uncharacterized protein (TIGR00299 family) protein
LGDIRDIIEKGELESVVKKKSVQIFEKLAEVEGRIHDLSPEEVHFHEVGAVDSILDIVGAVYGLHALEVAKLFVSPLPLGSGFVETSHGRIPLPAPATLALLEGAPVFDAGIFHELVTPTGAALVKGLASSFGMMPPMVLRKTGYGVGGADFKDRPNLVRILLGDEDIDAETDTVAVLETNVDDSNPEWLGHMMALLFEEGALDVVFFPVQMKKNRPGVQIQVIARPDKREALTALLFRESTTLGVRFQHTLRKTLQRSLIDVNSPWGKLRVKEIMRQDGTTLIQPEYEACRKIAYQHHLPLREVFHWVMALNQPSSNK